MAVIEIVELDAESVTDHAGCYHDIRFWGRFQSKNGAPSNRQSPPKPPRLPVLIRVWRCNALPAVARSQFERCNKLLGAINVLSEVLQQFRSWQYLRCQPGLE